MNTTTACHSLDKVAGRCGDADAIALFGDHGDMFLNEFEKFIQKYYCPLNKNPRSEHAL